MNFVKLILPKLIVITFCAFFFPISSSAQEIAPTEPSEITHADDFIIPVGLNDDEKRWYVKFQEGNFLVEGWQEISTSILKKTPDGLKSDQKRLLENLGMKIGTEWCKDNEVRKVDNSKLKEWGKSIKQTAKKNPQSLHALLVSINNEVDSLLD